MEEDVDGGRATVCVGVLGILNRTVVLTIFTDDIAAGVPAESGE